MKPIDVRIGEKGDTSPLFPELSADNTLLHHADLDRVGILQAGMESGLPSVAPLATLPDGSVAIVECSARNFMALAGALRGACQRWGISAGEVG